MLQLSHTFGPAVASLSELRLSSGQTYSKMSLGGRPRAVPWRDVDGMLSSSKLPRSVSI